MISCIALFVSLGGVGYAAATIGSAQIKNNAVQGKDIKNSSVTGKDIKTGSVSGSDLKNDGVTGTDVKESTLGQVPSAGQATTAANATHATTADTATTGAPIGYARIAASGAVDEAQSKNVADANVTNPSAGRYCFNGLSFTPKSVQVTAEFSVNNLASATTKPFDHFACTGLEDAEVTFVIGGGGTTVNAPFFIVFH